MESYTCWGVAGVRVLHLANHTDTSQVSGKRCNKVPYLLLREWYDVVEDSYIKSNLDSMFCFLFVLRIPARSENRIELLRCYTDFVSISIKNDIYLIGQWCGYYRSNSQHRKYELVKCKYWSISSLGDNNYYILILCTQLQAIWQKYLLPEILTLIANSISPLPEQSPKSPNKIMQIHVFPPSLLFDFPNIFVLSVI